LHAPVVTKAKNDAHAQAEKAQHLFVKQHARFDPVTNADHCDNRIYLECIPTNTTLNKNPRPKGRGIYPKGMKIPMATSGREKPS